MNKSIISFLFLAGVSTANAAVQILSMTPSPASPQPIGTPITWTVTATDSGPGPLTFQFNVARGGGPFVMVRDFNVGTLSSSTWTSQPFVWNATDIEGTRQIQVVAKDFSTNESTSMTALFQVTPLVTGSDPVVVATANPIVAFFSAPPCPSGSFMRVVFHPQGSSVGNKTNWADCHAPATMTFEIAGMYPSTTYVMYSQTATGTQVVTGPSKKFTTGALPNLGFPAFTVNVPPGPGTDTADGTILHGFTVLGSGVALDIATDLVGNVNWYYSANDPTHSALLTRPLKGGHFLTVQSGMAWNPLTQELQFLREIDLAGNVVRETNIGIVQHQLFALGATDAQACNAVTTPTVGSACLGGFHHDAIRLPNGFTAVLADIEKIFPIGTQNDTSGLPVDIIGDIIIVLDSNWQVVWWTDTFQQLDINRAAVLGETCANGQGGCPPLFLVGKGTTTVAHDWLHGNSLYYWPKNGAIVYSTRHQDWVIKFDYNNGLGTGQVLWRLGLDGDFAFPSQDPYPWFSHQHDVGFENNGAGVLTLFDNGNTRVSPPPVGLGSGNSRGMALIVDETTMQVTAVLSADLGVYALALGSAQLLSNGNYFYQPGIPNSYCIEILPTSGTLTGTQVLNLQSATSYRSFQVPDLYTPPIT